MQRWLMTGVLVMLCACGAGNAVGNGGGGNEATQGATLSAEEQKARGVVEQMMTASMAQDQETALALLIKAEREKPQTERAKYGFNRDGDMVSYTIGEVRTSGDEIEVHVSVEMKDPEKNGTMPIVTLREGDERRISMDRTFSRYIEMLREKRKANCGG